MKVTKDALASFTGERTGEEEGEVTMKGTLFIVEEAWGYNIQPYSLYPEEEEILLEPESVFEVTSVVDSDEFSMVTLKMLDTSPILTKIFGENKQ